VLTYDRWIERLDRLIGQRIQVGRGDAFLWLATVMLTARLKISRLAWSDVFSMSRGLYWFYERYRLYELSAGYLPMLKSAFSSAGWSMG